MEKLIAVVSIQYKGKRYIPGEEIPADNAEMVEAWKRAESVKVLKKEEDLSKDKKEILPDKAEDPAKASGDGTTEDPAKTSEDGTTEEPAKAPVAEGKKKK